MKRNRLHHTIGSALTALALGLAAAPPADACTRVVFLGDDDTVITGRSMDWSEDLHTNRRCRSACGRSMCWTVMPAWPRRWMGCAKNPSR